MARAAARSTSLPKGLQPTPMAETRSPDAPSLRKCMLSHGSEDLVAEAAARFRKHVRRRVAAVADDHHVVQTQSNEITQPLGNVLRRSDDPEAVDEVVGQSGFVP